MNVELEVISQTTPIGGFEWEEVVISFFNSDFIYLRFENDFEREEFERVILQTNFSQLKETSFAKILDKKYMGELENLAPGFCFVHSYTVKKAKIVYAVNDFLLISLYDKNKHFATIYVGKTLGESLQQELKKEY